MCMCVKSFCVCSVSFLFLSLCSVVHYARDCSCMLCSTLFVVTRVVTWSLHVRNVHTDE